MKISSKAILLLGLVLLASAVGQSQSTPKQKDKTGEGKPEGEKPEAGKPEGGKPEGGKPRGRKPCGKKSEPLMCYSKVNITDASHLKCCKVCTEDNTTATYACKQMSREDMKKARNNTELSEEELEAKKAAKIEFIKNLKENKCCEPKEDKNPIMCSLKGEVTPPTLKCFGQTEEGSLKCYPSFMFRKRGGKQRWGKKMGKIWRKLSRKGGRGGRPMMTKPPIANAPSGRNWPQRRQQGIKKGWFRG